MMHRFNLLLSIESESELTKTKGQMIRKIERDDFGDWSISILIRLDNGECAYLRNDVDLHSDYKDEYIQFVVSNRRSIDIGDIIVCSVGKTVNKIQMVTDYVKWKHNKDMWAVQADIGIIFILDDGEEILIEAVDSIAGFMRYYQGQNCIKQLRSIEEQWQMKTDALLERERCITDLC